jgi:hypothetical protein
MTQEETSIARAESELYHLLGWVRAVETRLALVLSLSTAMLGILAVLAPPASKWIGGGIAVALAIFFLLPSISIVACVIPPDNRNQRLYDLFRGEDHNKGTAAVWGSSQIGENRYALNHE